MGISNVFSLFGGLAIFLFGMNIMGSGLEKHSGGKMERVLEKLTGNIFLSVLVGMVVTATVQSSSATTVIVVGLVNAKILSVRQAIGVIMGANIGTTITAQIIRLSDISSDNMALMMLKPSTLAPLAAIAGIVFYLTSKSSKKRDLGQILLGFSILFTGLFAMEDAVRPLRDLPEFVELLSSLSNPVLGVLAGAFVTAVIQSSSASVGILQAISSTGILMFSSAFPIIMGQNIGTCITPILSSIGGTKNAKRAALVHLYFNIIGTLIILVGFYGYIAVVGEPSFWNEMIDRTGIANFHTLFNIAVTLLFLPFTRLLEKLAYSTIKKSEDEIKEDANLLDERFIMSPSIALQQVEHVISDMAKHVRSNFYDSLSLLDNYDFKTADRVKEVENTIDKADDKVENYLIKLSASGELNQNDSRSISTMMHLINDFERMGDHSTNITEVGLDIFENNVKFSETALHELGFLSEAVGEIIEITINSLHSHDVKTIKSIEPLEDTIDAMVALLKDRHIDRVKKGLCQIHAGISFLEVLSNLERISDHCSNVGIYLLASAEGADITDKHEYAYKRIHDDPSFAEMKFQYMLRYYGRISEQ